MSISHSFFMMTAFALLFGCAGNVPKEFSCRAMNWQVAEPGGPRIEKATFSVAQPVASVWCLTEEQPSPSFFTTPLLGQSLVQPPPDDEQLHTVALFAAELRVPTYHLREADDLEAFVEKWLRNGQLFRIDGDRIILNMKITTDDPILESRVWQDERDDAECVRYEFQREQRHHPRVPGRVLVMHDYGMVCRAHDDRPTFAMAVLTERQLQRASIDPVYFDELKAETADPFFEGLRFHERQSS